MKKTQRHEKLSVIQPPSGGPIAGAVTMATLYRAKAAGPPRRGKGIHQDRLLYRSQTPSTYALQHAKDDQQIQARRNAAKKRCNREQPHADHVVAFPARRRG